MNRENEFDILRSIFNGERDIREAKKMNDGKYDSAFQFYMEAVKQRRHFLSGPLNAFRFVKAGIINREIERRRAALYPYEFAHNFIINLIYPQTNTREEA